GAQLAAKRSASGQPQKRRMPGSGEPGIRNPFVERLVDGQPGLELGAVVLAALQRGTEVLGNRVGDDVEALDDGHAVTDLMHDHRDGGVERICDRRENLRAGLFLAALNLAEVSEGDTCAARDLT